MRLLDKAFAVKKPKSDTPITMSTAPHVLLSRSLASDGASFVTDGCVAGVLDTTLSSATILGSAATLDWSFGADKASFIMDGCDVGALGSSPSPFDGT